MNYIMEQVKNSLSLSGNDLVTNGSKKQVSPIRYKRIPVPPTTLSPFIEWVMKNLEWNQPTSIIEIIYHRLGISKIGQLWQLRGISYQEMCLKRPSMVGQYLDELAELMCVMQFAVDYNNISKRNQGLVNYKDYMNLRGNFYMEFKNMYTPHKYELADEDCEDEIKWEENVDTSRSGSHTNVEEPYAMFRGNHINISPINSTLHNEASRISNTSRNHSVRTRSHSRERFLSEQIEDDVDEEGH